MGLPHDGLFEGGVSGIGNVVGFDEGERVSNEIAFLFGAYGCEDFKTVIMAEVDCGLAYPTTSGVY